MKTSTINIPNHWTLPKYSLGQRTKQGIIVGIEYHPPNSLLANQCGELWRYSLLVNENDESLEHWQEYQIQPLSLEELRGQLLREIEVQQKKVAVLTQQLKDVTDT